MELIHNTAVLVAAGAMLFMLLTDPDKLTNLSKGLVIGSLHGAIIVAVITTLLSMWA